MPESRIFMPLNELRKLCRAFCQEFLILHPDFREVIADGWVKVMESLAKEASPTDLVFEMYNHPDFQRVMVELEDERIFQDPEMN